MNLFGRTLLRARKLCHLNSFDPEDFEDDATVVEMQSLGRAKGFTVTGEHSALDDKELMDIISRRLHVILGVIEGEERGQLERNKGLEETVEALEDEVRSLEEELTSAREKIEELEQAAGEEDEYDDLLELVNEALGDIYSEEFDDLDSAVRALVDEYLDAVEEAEDEG